MLEIGGVLFELQMLSAPRTTGHTGFVLYKDRAIMERYAALWATLGDFHPQHVIEIGIWAGGSIALWGELLEPKVLVAIDVTAAAGIGDQNLRRLEEYVRAKASKTHVCLSWGTDQADARRLRNLVRTECAGTLDLVIDDASHTYVPTKASFEALFPYVRPGGWYIIEDWGWAVAQPFPGQAEMLRSARPPTPLVFELVELAESTPEIAKALRLTKSLLAVERGEMPLDDSFRIGDHIREQPTEVHRPLRGVLRRLLRAV